MESKIYHSLLENTKKGKKSLAVLIDPDKTSEEVCHRMVLMAVESKVDYLFVGGSLMTSDRMQEIIKTIKSNCNIPVVIFPGSNLHIDYNADAILFLSLISGRNPEFLIGQHVVAAPIIKQSKLETLPTGYILVDSGSQTTVSYISNTTPIPSDKYSIAACTAMAGEMLGLKLIYLDGGSGARNPVPSKMISYVRKSVDTPIIVGGGLDNTQKIQRSLSAGADLVVVGNSIEAKPEFLVEAAETVQEFNALNIH